jgi:hypothetical protein
MSQYAVVYMLYTGYGSPLIRRAPFLQPAASLATRPLTPSKAALTARLLDARTLFLRIGEKDHSIETALVTNIKKYDTKAHNKPKYKKHHCHMASNQ